MSNIIYKGVPASNGSDLCISCGLCCRGVLHNSALVEKYEINKVRKLGLSYFKKTSDKSAFKLPCVLFIGNKCSIYYSSRPSTCVNYRCKLLKRLLNGEINISESKQVVSKTKNLVGSIESQLPINDFSDGLWLRISAKVSQINILPYDASNIEFMMACAKLRILLQKYFWEDKDPMDTNHSCPKDEAKLSSGDGPN
jgi:hypothetical protein